MRHLISAILSAALLLPACGGDAGGAKAEVQALGDSGVRGTVTFTPRAGGKVWVEAVISGLTPGKHGFHIHEFGDCSAPDGKSAGEHFNPESEHHGAPGPGSHHGDLGNLEADPAGNARLSLETADVVLDASDRGVIGRAVIVHADPDDLVSQPVGKAGDRVACGVIQRGDSKPVLAPK